MSDKKKDDNILKNIDEADAMTYRQIFGIFNKADGNYVEVKLEEKAEEEKEVKPKKERKKTVRETKAEIKDQVEQILNDLLEKDISSMVIKIKINGKQEEYVNDEKAGIKFLSKEDQIKKIRETIKGFKNVVIVHSEEELLNLQEEYKKKQEKAKVNEDKLNGSKVDAGKATDKKSITEKTTEVKTQVYVRISEKDYEDIKSLIENADIKVFASKVKMRDDKTGVNMVMKKEDLDNVKDILKQKNINILQEVEGNVDWNNIKSDSKSKKFDNITIDQLKEFQSNNKDKFDYIAFRKGDEYTVYADKSCDIEIGATERKTIKQLESNIKEYRKDNTVQKPEKVLDEKNKNSKEVAR